jgi:hypothetical protein
MNRLTGIIVAEVLTFSAASAAMILVLGSCAFFVVGVLVVTGDEGHAPVSVAIAGMALAGAFLLLILALAAGWLALNIVNLRDWTRTISFTEIAASTRDRLRSVFAAIGGGRLAWPAELASSHKSRRPAHHPWRGI